MKKKRGVFVVFVVLVDAVESGEFCPVVNEEMDDGQDLPDSERDDCMEARKSRFKQLPIYPDGDEAPEAHHVHIPAQAGSVIRFALGKPASLLGWTPTVASLRSLAIRWASWQPANLEDVQMHLQMAANE